MTHAVTWKVSLSNGETLYEGVGLFAEVEGEISPWNKLIEYISKNSLQITSLSLVVGNRTFNLPSAGKNPKFKWFNDADKPIGYKCLRALGQDRNNAGGASGEADWFTIGVAIYPNYELQLWVDNKNTNNCWTLVLPLEHNKV